MPLVIHREVAAETQLGIWKIEEDAAWFRSQLILDDRENELIDSIRHPQRKLHWLSSRVLLRCLMKTDQFIHLESDANGKPVIHNFNRRLSLSHSGEYSALLLSEKLDVGIDIEKMDPKVFRIEHKFIGADERLFLTEATKLVQLYVIWCAKEAMYKLYGEKLLDFREHLHVKPFQFQPSGILQGSITKGTYKKSVNISWEQLGDYMIAYTTSA